MRLIQIVYIGIWGKNEKWYCSCLLCCLCCPGGCITCLLHTQEKAALNGGLLDSVIIYLHFLGTSYCNLTPLDFTLLAKGIQTFVHFYNVNSFFISRQDKSILLNLCGIVRMIQFHRFSPKIFQSDHQVC